MVGAVVLFVWACIAGLYAGASLSTGVPGLREMQVGISLLIATVATVGAFILDTLNRIRKELRAPQAANVRPAVRPAPDF